MRNTNDDAGPTGLATGTKITTLIAAALLAVAVYLFVAPTSFRGKDGSLFGCGSPISPNTSGLAKGQCNILEGQSLHRALLFLALSIIVAALGFLLFGTHGSRGSSRGARAAYDDDDDDARPRRARSPRPARLGDEDVPEPQSRMRRLDDDEIAERD